MTLTKENGASNLRGQPRLIPSPDNYYSIKKKKKQKNKNARHPHNVQKGEEALHHFKLWL